MTEDKEDPFLKDGSLREVQVRVWYPKDYDNTNILESGNENYENIYYERVGLMGLCDLSLASPILASILDQQKSEVEPREQLKRLNADCLDFLQRLSLNK